MFSAVCWAYRNAEIWMCYSLNSDALHEAGGWPWKHIEYNSGIFSSDCKKRVEVSCHGIDRQPSRVQCDSAKSKLPLCGCSCNAKPITERCIEVERMSTSSVEESSMRRLANVLVVYGCGSTRVFRSPLISGTVLWIGRNCCISPLSLCHNH